LPSAHHVFPEHDLLLVRYWGVITPNCVLRLIDELDQDPRYRTDLRELDDLRQATGFAISEEELVRMADLVAAVNQRSNTPRSKAILATDPDIAAALTHYTSLLAKQSKIDARVFSGLGDAAQFLGLDPAAITDLVDAPGGLN